VSLKDSLTDADLAEVEVIDVDNQKEVVNQYGIKTIPAVVKEHPSGSFLIKSGSMTRQEFLDFVNEDFL
jgi:hypothetical protein